MVKSRKIFIILLMIMCVVLLAGCEKKSDKNLKIEKANNEIKFLDNNIINMINELNNISFLNYKVTQEDIKEEKDSSNTSDSKTKEKDSNSDSEGKQEESSNNENKNEESKENNNKIFKMEENFVLQDNNEKEINWNEISKIIENIYTIWPTIYLDLDNLGVDKLSSFTENLDNIALDIKNKDNKNLMDDLSKIYNLISYYKSTFSNNEIENKSMEIKSYLILAYCNINNDEWNNAYLNIEKSKNIITEIKQSGTYNDKKINIERAYIMVTDLENSIEKKDKNIFIIRYKNILQELLQII